MRWGWQGGAYTMLPYIHTKYLLKKYLILWGCMLSRFSHDRLFASPWTVVHQAPLSTGFSRLEYWSGLPCPPPRDLSQPWKWTWVSCVSYTGKWVLYHYKEVVLGSILIKCKSLNIYYFLFYTLNTKEVVTMGIGKLFWLVVISGEIQSGKYDSGKLTIL